MLSTCTVLDTLPWWDKVDRSWQWRYGLGCIFGLFWHASRLDRRWRTGRLSEVARRR
jgi:hypothetical protein